MAGIPKIQRPATFTDWVWVVQFFGLPVIGGVVAWLYCVDGTALKPLLTVHIGVSAPLILKAMAAVVPTKPPAKVD